MGVVDEALPPNGRARLLKIDPHHNLHLIGKLLSKWIEFARVFQGTIHVVNRTGTHDDEQAMVFLFENATDGVTTADDRRRGGIGRREFGFDRSRRGEAHDFPDMQVLG